MNRQARVRMERTQWECLLSIHAGFRDVYADCAELRGQSRLGSVGQMAKDRRRETLTHRESSELQGAEMDEECGTWRDAHYMWLLKY